MPHQLHITPEQRDKLKNSLRPVFPFLSPEQLDEVIDQTLSNLPDPEDAEQMAAALKDQFPNLNL